MVFNPQAFVYHKHSNTLKEYLRVKYWRAYWRIPAYKKNPQKMIKDSYTPQLLKVQILIVGLIGISLCFTAFLGGSLSILLLLLMLIISSLPFAVVAFKKGATLGLLSPCLLFFRACTFLLGNLSGLINEVLVLKVKTWSKRIGLIRTD